MYLRCQMHKSRENGGLILLNWDLLVRRSSQCSYKNMRRTKVRVLSHYKQAAREFAGSRTETIFSRGPMYSCFGAYPIAVFTLV